MNILSIIIFAGFIQGVFLSVTLWVHNRGNRLANRLLALFILSFCLHLIIPELVRTYPERFPHFIASSFPILFTLGPLTLLYIEAIRCKDLSGRNLYLHFGPSILCVMILLPFFLQSADYKLDFYYAVRHEGMSYFWSLLWGGACLHAAYYSYWSAKQIQQYNERLKDQYSNIDEINLSWLKRFVLTISILWALYLLLFLISLAGVSIDPYGMADYIFSISIAIAIFSIGFMAFRRPEVFSGISKQGNNQPGSSSSYAKSGLDNEKAEKYATTLQELLEDEKPYLNADLTLEDLAKKIDLPPKYLSEVLNKKLDVSFYELMNRYRAQEAKRLIEQRSADNITMLEVMYDSGFNSKSTFNKYFKKTFRETPSQFRNKIA